MSYKPKILASTEGGTSISSVGTSGNVLISNGTNWASSAPTNILTVTGSLTSAQIKALHATPIQVIAAPVSGKMIIIWSANLSFKYGGTNAFTLGGNVSLFYGTTTSTLIVLGSSMTGTTSKIQVNATPLQLAQAPSLFDNVALNLYNSSATEFAGNAANDNTVDYTIIYSIITL